MAIPPAYKRELISRNDIYSVISRYVHLTRTGRQYKGLCPFHSERTPSFVVYPDTHSYYCFGCGASGDVISFMMNINGLSYIEAIRQLARECGMSMPDEDDGQARLKSRILEMNKLAARYFHSQLNSENGKNARKYLRDRQLSDKTIINFGLGYAPAGWQNLTDYLKSKGFSEDEIVTAYLGARGKKGGIYDVFRDRIIFPIIDLRGNVIAFGGRRMGDEGGPKYLNSGDTPVFKKSNGLFALNLAKKSGKDTFILAEGYMDVIAMHQRGFNNAVATLGTALTSQQARLIGDYAQKVVVSYDSDEAGQKATKRAMDIFGREDITVQVLNIEGAKDPDEYIKKYGRQRFEMLLNGANSALDFSLMKLKSQYDLSDADRRFRYIDKACDILADLNNPVKQDIYCSKLARETNVDKASIKLRLENREKIKKRQAKNKREKELLQTGLQQVKVDFRRPGNTRAKVQAQIIIMCALIRDNSIYKSIKNKLRAEDFTDPDMRRAYEKYCELADAGVEISGPVLTGYLPQSAADALYRMLATTADTTITEKDVHTHIEKLLTAKLSRSEAGSLSPAEIAERIRLNKEKKKK